MGRDCNYCGAYISDLVEVCPACGKRSKPEKTSAAEHWTGPYNAGAASQSQYAGRSQQEEWQKADSNERNQAYTYKKEYENRRGTQQGSGASRRPGQQAEPRSAGRRAGEWTPPHYTSAAQYTSTEYDDIRRNKRICFLCYFGPLFLIPYLSRPDSDFVKFHSNQGLLLLLLNAICGFVGLGVVSTLFSLVCFFIGISAVSRGEKKKLPLIGEIRLLR